MAKERYRYTSKFTDYKEAYFCAEVLRKSISRAMPSEFWLKWLTIIARM